LLVWRVELAAFCQDESIGIYSNPELDGLIIFPLIVQTSNVAQMLSNGGERVSFAKQKSKEL